MPVLALALLSMVCAAGNDFIFKLYARRSGPLGAYLAVIGVIWVLAFAAALAAPRVLLQPPTLFWGAVSGIFSIAANILYLVALKREDVGVCATIYRLNLVPAAFLAFLFFNEPASAPRLAAIGTGMAAVLFFSWPTGRAAKKPFISPAIAAVVLASLLRAGMGLSYKAGLLGGADEFGLMTINGCAWVAGGLAFHFLAGRAARGVSRATFAYGAVSGLLVCGIVLFLVLALKRGDASLVLPVTQMSFALTALAGIVFMHEPFTLRKCAGVSLGAACILLMGIR